MNSCSWTTCLGLCARGHSEIILSDSIGHVDQVEFGGCSLTQAGFFSEALGTGQRLEVAHPPRWEPQTGPISLATGLIPEDGSRERKRPVWMSLVGRISPRMLVLEGLTVCLSIRPS